MKIGWQLTKLLQKLSRLLFLAHPVYTSQPNLSLSSATTYMLSQYAQ